MLIKEPDQHRLEVLIAARYPIITIETTEEARLTALVERAALQNEWPLFRWTVTDAIVRLNSSSFERELETYQLTHALRHIYQSPQNGVFLFLDAHPFLDDPVNVRLIKNLLQSEVRRTLIFVSQSLTLPAELARYAATLTLTLPDDKALQGLLKEEAELWTRSRGEKPVRGEPDVVRAFLRALSGLPQEDVRRLIRQAIQDDGAITQEDVDRVLAVKNRLLNADRLLDWSPDVRGLAELGGLEHLKRWLDVRRPAFFGEVPGLDSPKGVMLTGIQGCGKSLAAKCVAGHWRLPLLRLDMGVLYNMYHGETERNLRRTLATADAMAPCVLWIDEIEKGVSVQDSASDGGLSRRVLGTLLTWLAERTSRVFLVATSNDIMGLPPELIRKGRFDEIFFVDLPSASERQSIFRIHLQRRHLVPDEFAMPQLLAASEGYSGADIEQAIISALYAAHAAQTVVDTGLLLAELQRTRPLSVVMAEAVAARRAWARERAVSASE